MKKLLSAELKRAFCSPLLWAGVCVIVIIHLFEILLSGYGFYISADTFLFYGTPVICVCLAVFIPLHAGQEFEVRTVNHKIIAGYRRKQIYVAEMVVAMVCGLIFLLADMGSVLLFAMIKKLSLDMTFGKLAVYFVICYSCIIAVSTLFTTIVMVMHRRLHSIVVAVCLTLLALQIGGNTVSALKQPEYRVEKSGSVVENPLHIDGAGRAVANIHVLLSPFAQAKYHPEMQDVNTGDQGRKFARVQGNDLSLGILYGKSDRNSCFGTDRDFDLQKAKFKIVPCTVMRLFCSRT